MEALTLSSLRSVPMRDRGVFNLMFFLQHYFPGSENIRSTKEASRLRAAAHVRRGGPGKVLPVDRVPNTISPDDFRRRYLSTGVPCIIENGIQGWPLQKNWTFDN